MSLLRDIGCRMRLHTWGPVVGDDRGAHQVCSYCGRTRRLHSGQPPEAHDQSGVHH